MDRKLQRHAARIANAVPHAAGEFDMVPVTGRQIGAGLRDADDRLAAAQLVRRDAIVHVALEIQRRQRRIGGIVEPAAGTQAFFSVWLFGHLAVLLSRFHADCARESERVQEIDRRLT